MKTTIEFLDAVKAKHGVASDYALAPILGVTRSAMSKYRQKKDFLGDSTAIRVAELLEIDPLIVVASVHFERSKIDQEKALWKGFLQKLGGLAASVVIALALWDVAPNVAAETQFTNSTPIYIMRTIAR